MAIQKKPISGSSKTSKKPAPKAAKPSAKVSSSDAVTPSLTVPTSVC